MMGDAATFNVSDDYLRYETSTSMTTTVVRFYKQVEGFKTATTEISLAELTEVFRGIIEMLVKEIANIADFAKIVTISEGIPRDASYLSNEIRIKPAKLEYGNYYFTLEASITPEWVRRVKGEYPEVVELSRKLKGGGELTEGERWNLSEIVEASGWSREDVEEDLRNLDVDPSEREEEYWSIFKKYYREAVELKNKGDDLQAAEKMWGAITALVKAYAARKHLLIEHWSRRKLDKFVANNVEEELRSLFEDLLTYGGELHEHFYEKRLPPAKFSKRWKQCEKLIEEIKAKTSPNPQQTKKNT